MTVQGPVKKQQPDRMSHRGSSPQHRRVLHPCAMVRGLTADLTCGPVVRVAAGFDARGTQSSRSQAGLTVSPDLAQGGGGGVGSQ